MILKQRFEKIKRISNPIIGLSSIGYSLYFFKSAIEAKKELNSNPKISTINSLEKCRGDLKFLSNNIKNTTLKGENLNIIDLTIKNLDSLGLSNASNNLLEIKSIDSISYFGNDMNLLVLLNGKKFDTIKLNYKDELYSKILEYKKQELLTSSIKEVKSSLDSLSNGNIALMNSHFFLSGSLAVIALIAIYSSIKNYIKSRKQI